MNVPARGSIRGFFITTVRPLSGAGARNGERVSLSFDLPCRQARGHSARCGEGPPRVDNFSGVLRGRECFDLLVGGFSFH